MSDENDAIDEKDTIDENDSAAGSTAAGSTAAGSTAAGSTAAGSAAAGSVRTRLASVADAPEIHRLLTVYRAEMGAPAREPLELELGGEGPLYVVVAEVGDRLAGMLVAHCCHNFMRDAEFLLLTDIYVEAEHRRHGAAGALMRAVEELAVELDCDRMSIIVAHINDAALTTAARAGFLKHDELLITRWLTGTGSPP
jgi:GNAT superfamily N-acetyltransferase